jgi:hypothetical protein
MIVRLRTPLSELLHQAKSPPEVRIEQAVEKTLMLAEKFFLFLEMLLSRASAPTATYPDGGPKVISQSQFVPMNLPDASSRR